VLRWVALCIAPAVTLGFGLLWQPNSETLMCAELTPRENRRSTRVRMNVQIAAQAVAEPLTCDGQTIVVNLHGALISTAVSLHVGMKIEIHVILTDKRAQAQVAYVDPDRPQLCGIGLDNPQNIWGVPIPPEDWNEDESR
jgi:translation initiation factor 6 (eIF-6)